MGMGEGRDSRAIAGGRAAPWDRHAIVNAILCILRSGCQWRLLRHDFPPYQTVFYYFRQWRIGGIWEKVNTVPRQEVRTELGREASPSAAIIDSQSVKTMEKGGFVALRQASK